jgi:hypothetical protein
MPVNTAAALVTNGYRQRLLDLRQTTGLATAGLLASVDLDLRPAALSLALAEFRRRALTIIGASQEQSGLLSLQYLLAYMRASGSELEVEDPEPAPPSVDPLTVVSGALFWQLGRQAGRAVAVASATSVATRVARTAVQQSAVATLTSGIEASPTITGYRRVTSSSCCQRCADAAAKGLHEADEKFKQVHPADRCTQEPVVAGAAERFLRAAPRVVSP